MYNIRADERISSSSPDREKAIKEALCVCMDLLEFSSWKCDRDAWKCLLKILQQFKSEYVFTFSAACVTGNSSLTKLFLLLNLFMNQA